MARLQGCIFSVCAKIAKLQTLVSLCKVINKIEANGKLKRLVN